MRELTKIEKREVKEVIRKGILRRHAEWQQQLRKLLDDPLSEDRNEFDRSMEITDKARKFFKEAMQMEDYYSNRHMIMGLVCLYRDGHLMDEDLESVPEDVVKVIEEIVKF